MIPYIEIHGIRFFGPFGLEPFGVLVVSGTALGVWYGIRRGREAGIDVEEYKNALVWLLGTAFFMAHAVEVMFYQHQRLSREGWVSLLKFWDGLSSMGGFAGAVLGLFLFYRLRRKPWLIQAELAIQSVIVGWVFGRLGCTIAHDHPGHRTDFFLGVRYPGGTRHDLGFYEFLFTLLVLVPAIVVLHRFKPPKGAYVALVGLVYAPVRFLWDFLRLESGPGSDVRYGSLTTAQYAAVALFLAGAVFAVRVWQNRDQFGVIPSQQRSSAG